MTRTVFMTPNGLPANGQVTTARDIAKLSIAYLRRFPESLAIHSLQSYTTSTTRTTMQTGCSQMSGGRRPQDRFRLCVGIQHYRYGQAG